MNRTELLKRSWFKVVDRLPPDTDDYVLLFNPLWPIPSVLESFIARKDAKIFLSGSMEISTDRIFAKWCPIILPDKEKMRRANE